ncbi:oxygen-independent coproporphyrinogen III oxidase [Nibricoccus sp. IMCC34717]|uniref:oxygen-independent coproporphyrinogen III oxidase n=1 Tax=Nibricoccus sp. IMCC34717 TaxID=3034021 RepID=UPI00384F041B
MISTHDSGPAPVPRALNLDLIRKYSIAGPRYTSYPPATVFSPDLASVDVDGALREDAAKGGPISIYFHLPFCETRCWYCGCNTVITRRRGAADEYLDDLAREIELSRPLVAGRPVTQLHLGGGTPTFLTPEQLDRLTTMVKGTFTIAPEAEISVELDPRRLTREHVLALGRLGARRASIGVQDTNRQVQLAINRFQPHELNQQVVRWLRDEGFQSINVDLIYGLPLQTTETFAQTIDDVLGLSPDRLSVFSYAHVPWIKPAQKIFEDRGQLPDAEMKLALFALAHERLTGAGFVDIGLDHFAKPGDELAVALRDRTLHRNFQGYSTRAGATLYAYGVSAISQTPDIYSQNVKDLVSYRASLTAGRMPVERGYRLTAEDKIRREVVMGIMCDRGLDFAAVGARTGVDVRAHFARELAELSDLEADGILKVDTEGLTVLPEGVPLLRVVAMRFDATLGRTGGRHAKVI